MSFYNAFLQLVDAKLTIAYDDEDKPLNFVTVDQQQARVEEFVAYVKSYFEPKTDKAKADVVPKPAVDAALLLLLKVSPADVQQSIMSKFETFEQINSCKDHVSTEAMENYCSSILNKLNIKHNKKDAPKLFLETVWNKTLTNSTDLEVKTVLQASEQDANATINVNKVSDKVSWYLFLFLFVMTIPMYIYGMYKIYSYGRMFTNYYWSNIVPQLIGVAINHLPPSVFTIAGTIYDYGWYILFFNIALGVLGATRYRPIQYVCEVLYWIAWGPMELTRFLFLLPFRAIYYSAPYTFKAICYVVSKFRDVNTYFFLRRYRKENETARDRFIKMFLNKY